MTAEESRPVLWGSMIPLVGGSALGCSLAASSPPLYHLSYTPFSNNEAHLKKHWQGQEAPWHYLDKEAHPDGLHQLRLSLRRPLHAQQLQGPGRQGVLRLSEQVDARLRRVCPLHYQAKGKASFLILLLSSSPPPPTSLLLLLPPSPSPPVFSSSSRLLLLLPSTPPPPVYSSRLLPPSPPLFLFLSYFLPPPFSSSSSIIFLCSSYSPSSCSFFSSSCSFFSSSSSLLYLFTPSVQVYWGENAPALFSGADELVSKLASLGQEHS